MINYTISSTTNRWAKRVRKIDNIINQVLVYKKDLRFIKNINYYCDITLANDKFVKHLNQKFRKVNQPTDVLTFISKLTMKNKKEDRKKGETVRSRLVCLSLIKLNESDDYPKDA